MLFQISHNIHPLEPLFNPSSVALIGAKEEIDSVGRTLIANLRQPGFTAPLFLVNPKHERVLGLPCVPTIAHLGQPVDLAIIATPARTVPKIILECAEAGVRAVIVVSAGFQEESLREELTRAMKSAREKNGMRTLGPNCLGVIRPPSNLNASFAAQMALDGSIAFISQSGAMCSAVLDWSIRKKFGFSAFVSIGSMEDIAWADLLDYFGRDDRTKNILIYMESIGNARDFLSIAKKVALRKPIILIKAGRTAGAAEAAASHTGALAGDDAVFEVAMRRVGILRVNSISELFDMALVLSTQPEPQGPNLTLLTNAGGPAVLATDALLLHGAQLTTLSKEVKQELDAHLPPCWSHDNPIDLVGDAPAERFEIALQIIRDDPNSDGLLVILSPQSVTHPKRTAEVVRAFAATYPKPLFASWMGGSSVEEGSRLLQASRIPTFVFPDTAARLFAKMWHHTHFRQTLYQEACPSIQSVLPPIETNKEQAHAFLSQIFGEGRTLLTESESKKLLALYGLHAVPTRPACSEEEAVAFATEIGFPVVLKLNSLRVTHKSDRGGVKLNLKTEDQVRHAFQAIQANFGEAFDGVSVQPMICEEGYELILGSSFDREFGPVILFGMGGQLVEIFQDTALALPPLRTKTAEQLINQTRISKAFAGTRGKPAIAREQLVETLVRFSLLIAEQPLIKECDINPILVTAADCFLLDARVVLHNQPQSASQLAITPYPHEYRAVLCSKTPLTIRPIMRQEQERVVQFYHSHLESDNLLCNEGRDLCLIDYQQELVLVVEQAETGPILALVHLERLYGTKGASLWIACDPLFEKEWLIKLFDFAVEVLREEGCHYLEVCLDRSHPQWADLEERYLFEVEQLPLEREGDPVNAVLRLL